jgi:aspartate aminotransferase-like enzyme
MAANHDVPRLFAPGPTAVHERVRNAMMQPLMHHRSPEFKQIMGELKTSMERLWRTPEWDCLVMPCSGTGAMEGAVVNFMRAGSKAINVSGGKFGERWAAILRAYGCEVVEVCKPWGETVTGDELAGALARHPDARAVYLTSADTSTGVEHPIPELSRIIRERSDALIVVDCICDFGGARDIRPAEWGIDVAVSASQKCLAVPPGLGLATISPRAWQFAETADLPRYYFDWKLEAERQRENITKNTSPVNLIRGLLESVRMIEEETLERVVVRHAQLARATRAAVTALGLALFPAVSSNGLTVVEIPGGRAAAVYRLLRDTYGYRIAEGQNDVKNKVLRLGHMGQVTQGDILGLLHVFEHALSDVGLCARFTGAGVAAAVAELQTEPPACAGAPAHREPSQLERGSQS